MSEEIKPSYMWGSVYEIEFDGAPGVAAPMPCKVAAQDIQEACTRALQCGWIQNEIIGVKRLMGNVLY